ncbi:hypothetical protein EDB83DRAFT_2326965 [Lactarius deliciosus]|nr:hypothetical protein EDB83DRAFT_2326965 [Lactarius deliciosus]
MGAGGGTGAGDSINEEVVGAMFGGLAVTGRGRGGIFPTYARARGPRNTPLVWYSMGPKCANDDYLTEAEEKIMAIAVRLDSALHQREKHPEQVDNLWFTTLDENTDEYQYWQRQINKIFDASVPSTRIHPIVPVVAEEWQAAVAESRSVNLDAMSLIEAREQCQEVARDHPTWPGKLSMDSAGRRILVASPPPNPLTTEPAADEEDNDDDNPDAPDGSATIRLRRSSRSLKGKAPARTDAEPVDSANVLGTSGDGGGVVPMDEDSDGDREETPRKPRIHKRQSITSPTIEASAPPKQRQRTNTIGESAAGIIEPLKISADRRTQAEGGVKRRKRQSNVGTMVDDLAGNQLITDPGKKPRKSCANCATQKTHCSPLARWAQKIQDDETSNPKPIRRRSAVAAIIGDVTPTLGSVRKTQQEQDARLTNMETTINNIDIMLRALCRVNGVNPNSLKLQIPPVPRFESPIRSASSASSAISAASTLSSSLNAQRMSLDDISAPAPSAISSVGQQGPIHSGLPVGKLTETVQPIAGPSSAIEQDLDDYGSLKSHHYQARGAHTSLSEPEDSMSSSAESFDGDDMYPVDYNDETVSDSTDSDGHPQLRVGRFCNTDVETATSEDPDVDRYSQSLIDVMNDSSLKTQRLSVAVENVAIMIRALCDARGIRYPTTGSRTSHPSDNSTLPNDMDILEVQDDVGCNNIVELGGYVGSSEG